MNQCPTCMRSKCDPFRVYNENGTVRYGCIDDFHTGHLTPISESSRWHNRPEARKHRKVVAEHLRTLKPYAV